MGGRYSAAAWGDYDNDGKPDILLAGRSITVPVTLFYHNNGAGTFTVTSAILPAVRDGSVAWGDCNNDGKLDILLTGDTVGSGIVSEVYLNNGGTSFAGSSAGLPPVRNSSAVWGDYTKTASWISSSPAIAVREESRRSITTCRPTPTPRLPRPPTFRR